MASVSKNVQISDLQTQDEKHQQASSKERSKEKKISKKKAKVYMVKPISPKLFNVKMPRLLIRQPPFAIPRMFGRSAPETPGTPRFSSTPRFPAPPTTQQADVSKKAEREPLKSGGWSDEEREVEVDEEVEESTRKFMNLSGWSPEIVRRRSERSNRFAQSAYGAPVYPNFGASQQVYYPAPHAHPTYCVPIPQQQQFMPNNFYGYGYYYGMPPQGFNYSMAAPFGYGYPAQSYGGYGYGYPAYHGFSASMAPMPFNNYYGNAPRQPFRPAAPSMSNYNQGFSASMAPTPFNNYYENAPSTSNFNQGRSLYADLNDRDPEVADKAMMELLSRRRC